MAIKLGIIGYGGMAHWHRDSVRSIPDCDVIGVYDIDPAKVAEGALRAAKKGRTIYTPRAFYKFYRVLAKIVPTKLMIKFAKT